MTPTSRSVISRLLAAAFLVAALALAVGCGEDDEGEQAAGGGDGGGGGLASQVDLSGSSFTVGSKEFTEQLILGQITLQALEAAGAETRDQTGLEGSVAARKALTSGEVDMYWEYTGTAWVNYLGHDEPVPDEQRQYERVKQEDLRKNNIAWLQPAPFNNTYAFAVRRDAGPELDQVETLSDLAELAETSPELLTLCVGEEFATRPDGLPGVEREYGFKFPDDQVSLVGDAVVYNQVAQGERCNFGSVFATDGRIEGLDLRVLEDDKSFFPFFNPAPNVRQQVFEQNQALADLLNPIAEALTAEVMTGLNAQVDVEGETPEDVAEQFLAENGFIG